MENDKRRQFICQQNTMSGKYPVSEFDLPQVNGDFSAVNLPDKHIENLANKWLEEERINNSWSDQTYHTYKISINMFVKWVLNRYSSFANNNNRDILWSYKEYLTNLDVKISTKNNRLLISRMFMCWLFDNGFINKRPRIKLFKTSRNHTKNPLGSDEISNIIKAFNSSSELDLRNRVIISLAAINGLRRTEIHSANIGDVKRISDVNVLYIKGKGHTEKDDFVKLSQGVMKFIKQYLNARKDKLTPESPLIAGVGNRSAGQRLNITSISRLVKSIFRDHGIDDSSLTLHSLRHSAATELIKEGVDLLTVQQTLRHAKIDTTTIYIKELSKLENTSADLLSKKFLE